eukprot:284818487_6
MWQRQTVPPMAGASFSASSRLVLDLDRFTKYWGVCLRTQCGEARKYTVISSESGGVYMSRAAEMTEGLKAMLGLEKEQAQAAVEPNVDADVLPPFSTCALDLQDPASIWQPVKVARRSSEKKKKVEPAPVPGHTPRHAPAKPPIPPQDESFVCCLGRKRYHKEHAQQCASAIKLASKQTIISPQSAAIAFQYNENFAPSNLFAQVFNQTIVKFDLRNHLVDLQLLFRSEGRFSKIIRRRRRNLVDWFGSRTGSGSGSCGGRLLSDGDGSRFLLPLGYSDPRRFWSRSCKRLLIGFVMLGRFANLTAFFAIQLLGFSTISV